MHSPRTLARAARAIFVAGLATPVGAQQLRATEVAPGVLAPIGLTSPGGDVHRLFILERAGRIRIVRDGVLLATPFLDIQSQVSTVGEGGLLGLAFHPDYANNGRFFVSFIGGLRADPRVREYRVSVNPDLADPASALDVLAHFPYATAHLEYGSDIHFGPDGMLYYSLGQGGDSRLSQRLGFYNGKLLRLDVDAPPPHVPFDNPYADPSDGALDLIWARGLRNPWRFSFDRLTGDLYIGDVGGMNREEVDFQPNSFGAPGSPGYQGGRNYGWPCMEASTCTNDHHCVCDTTGATLALPVFETLHNSQNSAMIGGFVYRGSAIPGLRGQYFCADFVTGTIRSFAVVNGQATNVQDRTAELNVGVPGGLTSIDSFGEDANGEIYLMCLFSNRVFRIDPAIPSCTAPVAYCSTSPNSVGSGAQIDSTGSASIAGTELVLLAEQAPPGVLCSFLCGTQEIQVPFGNGWSCVAGNVIRFPYLDTDAQGRAAQPLDYSAISVTPGQTRDFQFSYRDPAAGGAQFNQSDALRVVFCP